MNKKISFGWSIAIIAVLGTALVVYISLFSTKIAYTQNVPAQNIPPQGEYVRDSLGQGRGQVVSVQHSSGIPIRLQIPVIKVDAVLEHVGLTPQGLMDVPTGATDAAWFDLGPRPGEKGSAVIDGHFGTIQHVPAVFNNVFKLKKGDKIFVGDQAGATTTFVVRELRSFGQNDNSAPVFTSTDGKSHLNLITCEGIWNKAAQAYPKRLVVFADKVMK